MANRSLTQAIEQRKEDAEPGTDSRPGSNSLSAEPDGFDTSTGLDNPHPLFDYPLEEVFCDFLDWLDEYADTEAIYTNATSGTKPDIGPPLAPFKHALDEVVETPQDHEGLASLATENTLSAANDRDSWEEVASLWFWQYFSAYNRLNLWETDQVRRSWEELAEAADVLSNSFTAEGIVAALEWHLK